MYQPPVSALAVPGVCALIAFLSYSSQWLFGRIEPYPLDQSQAVIFNALVACIWICYYRAIITDPGRVPREGSNDLEPEVTVEASSDVCDTSRQPRRWCKKCKAPKPPRAHHCKECQRCIPKMDHHCPWTTNCVSHNTIPHFLRFVFYAVAAMTYLQYFLYVRADVVWQNRNLPSYLDPSTAGLTHLFILILVNSLTLFALSILLVRSIWALGSNTTTIEGWEIDRHHALLRRARILGGHAYGPNGIKVKIKRQEFPYDIGIWKNLKQGMGGSSNFISWFWPFAATPSLGSAMKFEINGFEDPSLPWPPLDPERIPRTERFSEQQDAFTHPHQSNKSPHEEVKAFRQRQREDLRRRQVSSTPSQDDDDYESESEYVEENEWTNKEGERLKDFGVDEDAELYDDDEVPLAELLRRRRGRLAQDDTLH